jgi:glucan biosynthesis protein C
MNTITERRHYIDWVRVLAFSILIFFHCAMPFVTFGWEVKNPETSVGLTRFVWWLHQWRLPLLFFISGVGIFYSLKRRSVWSFAGERFVRLFIPLAFAMLFTIPFQVYYEWLQTGKISSSYAEFYPSVWNFTPYPDGSLTWSHMWFVVYLFVFCMLLLPLFALVKVKAIAVFKKKLANWFSNPVQAGLLVIPLMAYYFALYLKYPEQLNLFDDWFNFFFSFTLLLYGFFLGGSDHFWQNCEKYRYYFLLIAAICIIVLYYEYWWDLNFPTEQNSRLYCYSVLNAVHIWMLILGILGMAKRHLNFSNAFLTYANEAVYPLYILHQTLIVIFGYYVAAWNMSITLKLIILMAICFISLLLIYELIVKRFTLTRVLYGLKTKKKIKYPAAKIIIRQEQMIR